MYFFSRRVKENKGTWYKKHPKNHSYSNHPFSGAKLVCGECKLLLKRGLQRCAGIKEAHRWEPRKNSLKTIDFKLFFWLGGTSFFNPFYIREHKPHSLSKNGVPHHFGFRNPKTNTNNKHTHLHHEKKYTKRPITPLPVWGRFPPLRFLFLLRHSWRHQPSHNINPGLWVSFCCGFVWISTAPIGCRLPGVFVVSALAFGKPSTHRWTVSSFQWERDARRLDTGHRALNGWVHRGGREIFHWKHSSQTQRFPDLCLRGEKPEILSGKIPGDDWKELMNLKDIFSMEKQLDKIALACTISVFFFNPRVYHLAHCRLESRP